MKETLPDRDFSTRSNPTIRGRQMPRFCLIRCPHIVAIILVVLLQVVGCNNPHNLPRPSDAAFIGWLHGQTVTYEKGVIFDSKWVIEEKEVSDFKVITITENSAKQIYSATVAFRATAHGKGIEVNEALLRYRPIEKTDKLQFVDLVPLKVSRIGN